MPGEGSEQAKPTSILLRPEVFEGLQRIRAGYGIRGQRMPPMSHLINDLLEEAIGNREKKPG